MEDWKLEPARDLGLSAADHYKSLRREAGLGELLLQAAWWTLIRGYLLAYHRFRVIGRANIPPQPPFILIANHTSHLDALCLAASLPWRLRQRVFPVAAGDTFFHTDRAARFSAVALNALPMWRHNCGRHALRELRERMIAEPCSLILFPEGTRSRDGALGEFKPGLGMLVAASPVPVVPCHIDGAFRAYPPGASRPKPTTITIRIGSPLHFDDTPATRDGWEHVTATARSAVTTLRDGLPRTS